MSKNLFIVLVSLFFGFTGKAQNYTDLTVQPVLQKVAEKSPYGIVKIKLIIKVEKREVELPEYVKNNVARR